MTSLAALATARTVEPPTRSISLPPQIKHLSASSIGMWLRCHEQYRRRYILGQKERPGEAMILGSAEWDAQVLGNFTQKIKTGTDVSTDVITEAFDAAFKTSVDRVGGPQEVAWDTNSNDAHALGLKMATSYHESISPKIQPIDVETEFSVYIEDVNVPVFGYIDLLSLPSERARGDLSVTGIIENKTSKAKVVTPKPEWRIQGRLYQLVQPAPINWHVVTKTKRHTKIWTPAGPGHEGEKEEEAGPIPALRIDYSESAAQQTAKLTRIVASQISAMYATLGPDEPWDGTGLAHTWACSRCGWRSSCAWWANQ